MRRTNNAKSPLLHPTRVLSPLAVKRAGDNVGRSPPPEPHFPACMVEMMAGPIPALVRTGCWGAMDGIV